MQSLSDIVVILSFSVLRASGRKLVIVVLQRVQSDVALKFHLAALAVRTVGFLMKDFYLVRVLAPRSDTTKNDHDDQEQKHEASHYC